MLVFQVANYILIKSTILLWTVTIFVTVSTFITPLLTVTCSNFIMYTENAFDWKIIMLIQHFFLDF